MPNEKDNERDSKIISLEKVRKNPWMLATIVLGVVLVVSLIIRSGGTTGSIVSSDVAAQNLISFIEAQSGSAPELVSSQKNGSFYEVVVKYQGQDIPVYVSLDGNYIAPSIIPLNVQAQAATGGEQTSVQIDVPKSSKPKVELFVMALCPFGLQTEKGILPVVNLLKDKIDFKVKFVYYAMHDKTEIDENTRQYCIQKEQASKFNAYLACYLNEGKSEDCLTTAGIDKAKLDSCVASADKQFNITANYNNKDNWISGQFPRYDVNLADNNKYNVAGSPTLVINGVEVSVGRDSASMLKAVCSAFTTEPSECSQTLSSTKPAAGFGYSASSSDSGANAGCASA